MADEVVERDDTLNSMVDKLAEVSGMKVLSDCYYFCAPLPTHLNPVHKIILIS